MNSQRQMAPFLKTLCRAITWAGAFSTVTALAEPQITLKAPGYQPAGLAYDGRSLFVAENSGFRRIHKLDPVNGTSQGSFLAPSPTGLDGKGNPNDIVSDGAGRLFVCDIGRRVYEINDAGTKIFQSFAIPFRGGAIAFDGRNLYISDVDTGLVRVTDRAGRFLRNFQSKLRPAGMVFDSASRNLWVISIFDGSVTEISTTGIFLRSFTGPRNARIQGLGAITKVGSKLYIAEVSDTNPYSAPEVPGTIFSVDVGSFRTPGYQPSGLASDGKSLFVAENSGSRKIHRLHPTTGAVLRSFLAPSPTGLDGRGNPNDLTADGAGRLFVSDMAGLVYEINDTGTKIHRSFTLPFRGGALAFDGRQLYISDADSGLVQVTNREGRFVRSFQSGLRAAGMCFDPASGNLLVVSMFDSTISEITTQGVLVRSFAGPQKTSVQGLGGIAKFSGRLYICEVSDPDPFSAPEVAGTVFISP